jgi:hypothetical protein
MHQVHVTAHFDQPLEAVFAHISDHRKFLTGGGLTCRMMKAGNPDKNGLGAVRMVRAPKITFIEEINGFELNKSYDYQITETRPKMPLIHHNGWLEFTEVGDQVKVDWHSHFTITTPIIGHLMGWWFKRRLEKVFKKRLEHVDQVLSQP